MMPLTGHGLVMDKSGQVYWYLFNQNKKDCQRFVDTCPVIEGESFQTWYEWNVKMLKKCYECCTWIPNYFLQNNHQGSFGYIMKDLNEDPDADLDPLFKFCFSYWTATMNEALTRTSDPVLSTKQLTARYKSCNDNPWYFICQMNLLYHPNLVPIPTKLYSHHPAQNG